MENKRSTILLVDDEPQNLHLLVNALKDDYELLVAGSGAEAIKRAHNDTQPDLILLDIVMPNMDGLQVCRILKADAATRGIPIIFITARDEVEDETDGLAAGAVDYITKPFSPAIVQARVRTQLKLKMQTDLLTRLAGLDGLTSLPNRRQFDTRFEEEWRSAIINGKPMALIMMDIDHFKQYNDHYGHHAGDECLRQVAAVLNSVIRDNADMVARYGGEEFVALLHDSDLDNSMQVGERFRQRVQALGLEHPSSPVSNVVTLSVGTASCTPQCGDQAIGLLNTADRMLYKSKNRGRNRVCGSSAIY